MGLTTEARRHGEDDEVNGDMGLERTTREVGMGLTTKNTKGTKGDGRE